MRKKGNFAVEFTFMVKTAGLQTRLKMNEESSHLLYMIQYFGTAVMSISNIWAKKRNETQDS